MNLVYIYHSCYVIEGDGFSILIDFYKDTVFGGESYVHDKVLSRSGKLYVLSSHSHFDHFNPEIFAWKERKSDIQYIFAKDISDIKVFQPDEVVFLNKSDLYEDDLLRIKAFGSTDLGISFFIEVGGKKIFHAGDLNNWHWNEESTAEESQECENNYLKELEDLAAEIDFLDLVMFPVDPRLGKDYMRGSEQFVDRIKTGLFAPMHFGDNYSAVLAFKPYAESRGCKFIAWTGMRDSYSF
jgi:L-ascorbate metabolism protein UlaG (beta-lactamase superfamily)